MTVVVGLVSKDEESAYREEMQQLMDWCRFNNLSLNEQNTKEMTVPFRRLWSHHTPLNTKGSSVNIVKNTKLLSVHLSWSLSPSFMIKKAQQHLYFLQELKNVHLSQPIVTAFHRETIKSILSSYITI